MRFDFRYWIFQRGYSQSIRKQPTTTHQPSNHQPQTESFFFFSSARKMWFKKMFPGWAAPAESCARVIEVHVLILRYSIAGKKKGVVDVEVGLLEGTSNDTITFQIQRKSCKNSHLPRFTQYPLFPPAHSFLSNSTNIFATNKKIAGFIWLWGITFLHIRSD